MILFSIYLLTIPVIFKCLKVVCQTSILGHGNKMEDGFTYRKADTDKQIMRGRFLGSWHGLVRRVIE